MCHWPNDNVGHYLKDWETLGICNRQQSLSSITHSFNQLRSAATKIITWHKSVIAHNEFTMFFWTHKITSSPTRPFWSHPLRTWIRGTTQIKKLRCGLHSCSQDKPCEANLLHSADLWLQLRYFGIQQLWSCFTCGWSSPCRCLQCVVSNF